MVDEVPALPEVRGFRARIQTANETADANGHYVSPAYKQIQEVIHQQLSLVKDIAREIGEEGLADRIDHGVNYGFGYGAAVGAADELVGILEIMAATSRSTAVDGVGSLMEDRSQMLALERRAPELAHIALR